MLNLHNKTRQTQEITRKYNNTIHNLVILIAAVRPCGGALCARKWVVCRDVVVWWCLCIVKYEFDVWRRCTYVSSVTIKVFPKLYPFNAVTSILCLSVMSDVWVCSRVQVFN